LHTESLMRLQVLADIDRQHLGVPGYGRLKSPSIACRGQYRQLELLAVINGPYEPAVPTEWFLVERLDD
jgi:hypothetical protein